MSNQNLLKRSGWISPLILVIAWATIYIILYFTQGIVLVNEAEKYITQADTLIETGTVSHPSLWLYAIQILLIAGSKLLGAGYWLVILVQLTFSAIACISLYRLLLNNSTGRAAFICMLLFILNAPLQSFNLSLYTESLFYSFTIILSCYILRLKSLNGKAIFLVIAGLIIICFTRPTGLLFVPCVFLNIFFRFFKGWPVIARISSAILVGIIFIFILNLALGAGGELDFMLPFRQEHIICGVPTVTENGNSIESGNSVGSILNYIIQHPAQFATLAWKRTLAFFGLVRNYYSTPHNIYLAIYFYPLFILALASIKSWFKKNPVLLLYALSLIIITWSSVIVTCDDWHNRFFLSILPYIYILGLPALEIITGKFKNKTSANS